MHRQTGDLPFMGFSLKTRQIQALGAKEWNLRGDCPWIYVASQNVLLASHFATTRISARIWTVCRAAPPPLDDGARMVYSFESRGAVELSKLTGSDSLRKMHQYENIERFSQFEVETDRAGDRLCLKI